MEKYDRFVATGGLYPHIARGGAGTIGAEDVLNTENKDFDPGDNSFVYAIIPGDVGVKFEKMEEDSERVAERREGYQYEAHQVITGRFNKLKLESGSCMIKIAKANDYSPPAPTMGEISFDPQISEQRNLIVPMTIPSFYKLFSGEDIGFIIKIHREGLTEVNDIEFGTAYVQKDDENREEVGTFDSDNTEQAATIANEIATYYVAKNNDNLNGDVIDAMIDDDHLDLLIPIQLKEDGDYTITVEMVEMLSNQADELVKATRVLDKSTGDFTVAEALDDVDILAYNLGENQVGDASIDLTEGTIGVTVKYGTNLSALVAEFTLSPFASAAVGATPQVSGTTANDFDTPVTYVVTAEDETTTKEFVVTVTVEDPLEETEILEYSLGESQVGDADIDSELQTISVDVEHGTTVTALVATFVLSTGATAAVGVTSQTSGTTENDFTEPVTYIITAQDGTTSEEWVVTVTVLPDES